MGRKPKSETENKEVKIDNKPIESEKTDNINFSEKDMIFSPNFAEDFAYRFMNQYGRILDRLNREGGNNYFNPLYANSAMKRWNSQDGKPTEQNISKWLRNPRANEQSLRACSNFLFDSIQHYNRSISYMANLLNFDYELIPLNPPTIDSDIKTIDLYQRQKQKAMDWLRQFRVKEQFSNIMLDVVRSGGKCYYLRENDENTSIYLQSMPEDYVVINGRTDVLGYTYSLNQSFFYTYPEAMEGFAPEFYLWYQEFLNRKNLLNDKANPWRIMPYDKSVVFKWDDTRVDMIPPLSGTMLDAITISDYKDIIRLNIELQNYCLLYLETPLDKSTGKPVMSAQEVTNVNC